MRIKDYLELAGVPGHLHAEAEKCMRSAFWRMIPTLFAKALAFLGMGFVAGFTAKREAEGVRWAWLKPWDNNISINGDRGPWGWMARADGVPYSARQSVPDNELYRLDDGPEGVLKTLYNYWWRPGKALARERMSRATWLTRNPASGAANMLGRSIMPVDLLLTGATEWEHVMMQWRYDDGAGTQIWVLRVNGIWCIRFVRPVDWKIKGKSFRTWLGGGYGYKLHNAFWDWHCLDPNMRASVSHISNPVKAPKPDATIFPALRPLPPGPNGILPIPTDIGEPT